MSSHELHSLSFLPYSTLCTGQHTSSGKIPRTTKVIVFIKLTVFITIEKRKTVFIRLIKYLFYCFFALAMSPKRDVPCYNRKKRVEERKKWEKPTSNTQEEVLYERLNVNTRKLVFKFYGIPNMNKISSDVLERTFERDADVLTMKTVSNIFEALKCKSLWWYFLQKCSYITVAID